MSTTSDPSTSITTPSTISSNSTTDTANMKELSTSKSIKFQCPSFTTGPYNSPSTFLPIEAYTLLLDSIRKSCIDLLIIYNKKIWLGKRLVYPQKNEWLCGGRVFTSETPIKAASRLIKKELNLDINSNRFEYILTLNYNWAKRQQEPQYNGTADISMVYKLELNEYEYNSIIFDTKEYENYKWVDISEIYNETIHLHPALYRIIKQLYINESLKRLESAVTNNDNENIIKYSKEYIDYCKDITKNDDINVQVNDFL